MPDSDSDLDPGSPSRVDELLRRGRRLWLQEGQPAAARAAFLHAVALDPQSARAYNDLGCLSAEQGSLDRALRELFEARRLDPDFPSAARNYRVLAALVGPGAAPAGGGHSTLSGSLIGGQGSSFAEGLVDYLQAHVAVSKSDEEHRADAIQEVVTRVISLARAEDLPLFEALQQLRRSSTRAWVRRLIGVARRREGARLEDEESLPAAAPLEDTTTSLRLDRVLDGLREQVLARSQPLTRWRRRIVWDVFVGSLVEGIHLQRKEVFQAVRELGITRRRASEGVLDADLDLIRQVLRSGLPRE